MPEIYLRRDFKHYITNLVRNSLHLLIYSDLSRGQGWKRTVGLQKYTFILCTHTSHENRVKVIWSKCVAVCEYLNLKINLKSLCTNRLCSHWNTLHTEKCSPFRTYFFILSKPRKLISAHCLNLLPQLRSDNQHVS